MRDRLLHSLGHLNARMRPASAERVCYLHLGMNKAGSTSLQNCFHRYVDRRVSYLDLPQSNHSRHVTMRFCRPPPPRAFHTMGAEAQAGEQNDVAAEFDAAVDRAPGSLIVSAETFSAFPDVATCQRAIDYFRARFDRVEGVVYIRPPGGAMASGFQEGLKWGRAAPALAMNYPEYRTRLERWIGPLGPDDLGFVLLDGSALSGGDLSTDFASRVGIAADRIPRRKMRPRNIGMSAETVAALFCYRRAHGPVVRTDAARKANTKLLKALRSFGRHRFALHPDVLLPVLRDNAADIAWVEGRMGRTFPADDPLSDARLFRDVEEIAAYGTTLQDALHDWQKRAFPRQRPILGPPEDVLSGIVTRFGAGMGE